MEPGLLLRRSSLPHELVLVGKVVAYALADLHPAVTPQDAAGMDGVSLLHHFIYSCKSVGCILAICLDHPMVDLVLKIDEHLLRCVISVVTLKERGVKKPYTLIGKMVSVLAVREDVSYIREVRPASLRIGIHELPQVGGLLGLHFRWNLVGFPIPRVVSEELDHRRNRIRVLQHPQRVSYGHLAKVVSFYECLNFWC